MHFLQNTELQKEVYEAMTKAKNGIKISPYDHKCILGYLAAHLLYTNAQRPGVVQYMTIKEYEEKKALQNTIIIQVHKHKTSRKKGPAQIVITNRMIIDLLHDYYKYIRMPMIAASTELGERLFLMATGTECRKVYELMSSVAERFNINIPTPTTHRKMVSTDANEQCSPEDERMIQGHMSHSKQTAERYYQTKTIYSAVKSQSHINRIVQNRGGFTQKEDKAILTEWPLTLSKTPPLSFCKRLVAKHIIEKTEQQIQDRWKYLHKRNTDI